MGKNALLAGEDEMVASVWKRTFVPADELLMLISCPVISFL